MSNGTIHIVTTVDAIPRVDSSLPDEFKEMNPDGDAETLLLVFSFISRYLGIEPVLNHVVRYPADPIISTADSVNEDLVVVGNKGKSCAPSVR